MASAKHKEINWIERRGEEKRKKEGGGEEKEERERSAEGYAF